ncbi:MAG: tetratricopeptide repeat protein [Spirochaetes bacterium]|nr:tetratricopeptide repeat protein [Spirochaetota bacterium]
MKKIIISALIFFSIPGWSMDSKEMEEILRGIVEADSVRETEQTVKNDETPAEQPLNPEKKAESGPETDLKSSPSPEEALIKNGIQLYEASFFENAKQRFENFIQNFPESSYRDLASIWLSRIYLKENDDEKALNILKTIGSDSGEYPLALSLLGKTYLRKKEDAKAMEYFYRIASLFPDHELADDSLIEIAGLHMNSNRGNQAIEAAIKVIKDYKDRETLDDAYFMIARVFEKDAVLKDFSIARKIYKIFLKKATADKAPFFVNSPLIKKVKSNLQNIEINYYGKIISS